MKHLPVTWAKLVTLFHTSYTSFGIGVYCPLNAADMCIAFFQPGAIEELSLCPVYEFLGTKKFLARYQRFLCVRMNECLTSGENQGMLYTFKTFYLRLLFPW